MAKDTAEWEKLVDIKDFPDLQSEPNMIDTTTLSDPAVTQILGIRQAAAKGFKANYDLAKYTALKAKEGVEMDIAVWFGQLAGVPDGHDGKFVGKGMMNVIVNGAGNNAPVDMTLTFAMSQEFSLGE